MSFVIYRKTRGVSPEVVPRKPLAANHAGVNKRPGIETHVFPELLVPLQTALRHAKQPLRHRATFGFVCPQHGGDARSVGIERGGRGFPPGF